MKIEVLGSGCPKCLELEKRVREAVRLLGLNATVEHVYDLNKIIARNVFSTPALAIDGIVVSSGRLLTADEIAAVIRK